MEGSIHYKALVAEVELPARGIPERVLFAEADEGILDTAAEGGSSALYASEGFVFMGGMPGHAYRPRGGLCGTHFYYKHLR